MKKAIRYVYFALSVPVGIGIMSMGRGQGYTLYGIMFILLAFVFLVLPQIQENKRTKRKE